jgi:vacuolar-type H+-ATPase subunit H
LSALSDAERAKRYRLRRAGKPDAPFGKSDRSPVETLRRLGVDVGGQQRADDRVDAARARERLDRQSAERAAGQLASALIKARRAELLAFADWRRSPTSQALSDVESTMRMRNLLEDQLRELLLDDAELIADVLKAAGG